MIGERLGPFKIEALLGRGGMGAVYRAVDARGEGVALKVLPADAALDAQVAERFRKEAELLSSLAHPNIVAVKGELGTERGHAFYAMELVSGQSLARILSQRGRLEAPEAVAVALAVLAALEAAHARGVVHRDVKPANVLLARGGAVKVVDFGLARALDATRLTLAGQALGTPAYMSPEQADARPIDARSDIYSVGVLLYELLSGKPPFTAEAPLAILRQHLEAPVPPLAVALPAGLEGIVRRALDKDPARRFQSAGELAQAIRSLGIRGGEGALSDLAGGAETTAVTVAATETPSPRRGEGWGGGQPVAGPVPASVPVTAPAPVAVTVPVTATVSVPETLAESVAVPGTVTRARRMQTLTFVGALALLATIVIVGVNRYVTPEQRGPLIELMSSETVEGTIVTIDGSEARVQLADGSERTIPLEKIRKITYR